MPNNLLDDFSALNGHQDDTAFEALREYSNNGNDLIWTGRPEQGFRLRKADLVLIPFSLLWGGFAIFWELGVIYMDAGLLFQLWGLPFVAVGLYMIIGRFFHDRWYRARTFYGLTDKELIIKRPKKVQHVALQDVRSIDLQEGNNYRGSVSFEMGTIGSKKKQLPMVPASTNVLDAVKDADEAYRLIRQYKKAQRNISIDMGR